MDRGIVLSVDIDDCVCYKSPFQKLIQDHPESVETQNKIRDTPEFHEQVSAGPIAPWVTGLLLNRLIRYAHSILVPTGRPESMRYISEKWLMQIFPPGSFEIYVTEFTSLNAYLKQREAFIDDLVGYEIPVVYIDDSRRLYDYACFVGLNAIWIHDGYIQDMYFKLEKGKTLWNGL